MTPENCVTCETGRYYIDFGQAGWKVRDRESSHQTVVSRLPTAEEAHAWIAKRVTHPN